MIIIYDNKGQTLDRYTIFLHAKTSRRCEYIAASVSGLGVFMHDEVPFSFSHGNAKHLGERVKLKDLDLGLQRMLLNELEWESKQKECMQ